MVEVQQSQNLSASLARFETSFFTRFPFFLISYSSTIVVYASSSSFSLAVPMREESCVGYTPSVWDLRSLQSILNALIYQCFAMSLQRLQTALSLVYNNTNS